MLKLPAKFKSDRFKFNRFIVCLTIIGLMAVAVPIAALSAPANLSDFNQTAGGFIDLPIGSYVEGSVRFGGLQPDYKLHADPDLERFLDQIKKEIARQPKLKWMEWLGFKKTVRDEKIAIVTDLIRQALPATEYREPKYLEAMAKYKKAGRDITLGSYLQCQAGVCRENALLTHFALKAAGIKNKFGYVHVRIKNRSEDHAIVIIEEKGEKVIVDPYNSLFHMKKLSSEMNSTGTAQILRINSYPIYWTPKRTCSNIFSRKP